MTKRTQLLTSLLAGVVLTGTAIGQDGMQREGELSNLVLTEMDTLYFEPPMQPGMFFARVQIITADGDVVFSAESAGEPMVVDLLSLDLPDGEYRFEAVSSFLLDNERGEVEEQALTNAGRIGIRDGLVVPAKGGAPQPDLSQKDAGWPPRLLAKVLDVLVPTAHAGDLTAESPAPAIEFIDSNDHPGFPIWLLRSGSNMGNDAFFELFDTLPNNFNTVVEIRGKANQRLNEYSLMIGDTGNISMANGALFLTRAGQSLSLGSATVPDADFDIHDFEPDIILNDITNASQTRFRMQSDEFFLETEDAGDGSAWRPILRASASTPFDAIVMDAAGDVWLTKHKFRFNSAETKLHTDSNGTDWFLGGKEDIVFGFGTNLDGPTGPVLVLENDLNANTYPGLGVWEANPEVPLHVGSHDSQSAGILVENPTGQAAGRTLLELRNHGTARFKIVDTDTGAAPAEWFFAGSKQDFRVSFIGTPVEMRVNPGGNMFITGSLTQNSDRNAKRNIQPLDSEDILRRVTALDITRWEYRDTPGVQHVGPMAQDFHAAFGVGHDETGISSIDTAGVALAAIQALNRKLETENARLSARNEALARRLEILEARMMGATPTVAATR